MAQHGFARSTVWKWDNLVMDNEAGVSIRLSMPSLVPYTYTCPNVRMNSELEPTAEIQRSFPSSFDLSYVVTLAAHQLSTDIHVKNTDDKTLAFQALLHTYYAAEATKVQVIPLKGLTYINKVKNGAEETEEREAVDVLRFTDSVYKNASQEYEIDTGLSKIRLKSRELNDVVVWNPGPEAGAKIADMEDGGWCVCMSLFLTTF